ncbi:MAG: SpoIIE family protein phosphatase [Terriglobales bacterium]
MSQAAAITSLAPQNAGATELLVVYGAEQRRMVIPDTGLTLGRKSDRDLVLPESSMSREHAVITREADGYYIADLGSRSGTFVNGKRCTRNKLQPKDRLEFGGKSGEFYIVFSPGAEESEVGERSIVAQLADTMAGSSDLDKLRLFLEAARQLKPTGVVGDVVVTLLDSTLQLTKAERGFVFLRDAESGAMRLVKARDARGRQIGDDTTISRSILEQAVAGGSEFIVGDTHDSESLKARASIMAHNLRSVIAIPLHKSQFQTAKGKPPSAADRILGVLYLDSHFANADLPRVSHDILRAIASQAAGLLENAQLVEAEEAARRVKQELSIAAAIQQRLMTVRIPDVPFASLRGRNLPCLTVGGDFFDVVLGKDSLAFVVTDVSGKGISAAMLASVIQGVVYSQLSQGADLVQAATGVHEFLCQKDVGEKYATMLLARLRADGDLEFVNCGHVPPKAITRQAVDIGDFGSPPVGLVPEVVFTSKHIQLQPGDRFVVVTDGVVEAENAVGEPFGAERFESAAEVGFEQVFHAVRDFCGSVPLQDDCTVVEITYRGAAGNDPEKTAVV